MRPKLIDKFNQDPDRFPFLAQFQELMLGALCRDLTKKDITNVYKNKFKRGMYSISIDPAKLLLLSTEVEPEIYILAQETAKKVTGNYLPMEQLLHLLLLTFIKTYEKEPFQAVPFAHARKGARFNGLRQFQSRFSPYYSDYVRSWKDDE